MKIIPHHWGENKGEFTIAGFHAHVGVWPVVKDATTLGGEWQAVEGAMAAFPVKEMRTSWHRHTFRVCGK